MGVTGVILLLVGLALLAVWGFGAVAHRNIPVGTGYVQQTLAISRPDRPSARWIRVGFGLRCLGIGVLLLVFGL